MPTPPDGFVQGSWSALSLVVWGRYPSRLMHLPGMLPPPGGWYAYASYDE